MFKHYYLIFLLVDLGKDTSCNSLSRIMLKSCNLIRIAIGAFLIIVVIEFTTDASVA